MIMEGDVRQVSSILTIEEKAKHTLALTRSILNELETTQAPDKALEYCREIYRVAAQIIPGEQLIRAMESRLPRPRSLPAEDISLSTNSGKLVIARPMGELNNRIIYAATTPAGVYFGAVKYTRGSVTAAGLTPAWDTNRPEIRRARPEPTPDCAASEPEAVRGDCSTCKYRTENQDSAGNFCCRLVKKSARGGAYMPCKDVPADRCKYTRAKQISLQKRLTGETWHQAVVAAANRDLTLPEDYYPYIAWVESRKGLELATQHAALFAEMNEAGVSVKEILETTEPKAIAAKIYQGQRSTIKRVLAAAAITALQAWHAEQTQNAAEPAHAPIGNNHEGQKACP